jgi:hypothetical protein
MAAKNTDTIHELTSREIERQVAALSARRVQVVNERGAICSDNLKHGGASSETLVDADLLAAREHAKNLLNGHAAEFTALLSPTVRITRDKLLYREQLAIDLCLKVLGDKSLVVRAADAVAWKEAHEDEWLAARRETVLCAIRLGACEARDCRLLAQCPDSTSIRLPLANITNITEIPVGDLAERALAEGLISAAELRKAQDV